MSRFNEIGKTNTVVGYDNGYSYVQYHATKVIQWNNKEVILNSGGWKTVTTKKRINQAANERNLNFDLYQHKHHWLVKLPDGSVTEFYDGMRFMIGG